MKFRLLWSSLKTLLFLIFFNVQHVWKSMDWIPEWNSQMKRLRLPSEKIIVLNTRLINKEGARYFRTVVLRVDDGYASTGWRVVYCLIPMIPKITPKCTFLKNKIFCIFQLVLYIYVFLFLPEKVVRFLLWISDNAGQVQSAPLLHVHLKFGIRFNQF